MQDQDDRKASRALKQKGIDNSLSPRNEESSHYITIPSDTQLNNFHFDQQQLNIPVGDVVKWINHDTTDHLIQVSRIIPGSSLNKTIDFKNLTPFDTLPVKFNQPGEYVFQCLSSNHSTMRGTIFVS